MAIPTFQPPQGPSFDYAPGADFGALDGGIRTHKGYDETRSTGLIAPATVELVWKAATTATMEYVWSFLEQFSGRRGPFLWVPIHPVTSPTGMDLALGTVDAAGSVVATTYHVRFTWFDTTYGETLPSREVTIDAAADKDLTVKAPPIRPGATAWRIYATKNGSGQEKLVLTETASRTVTIARTAVDESGAEPPSANTLKPPLRWIAAGNPERRLLRPGVWSLRVTFMEQFV